MTSMHFSRDVRVFISELNPSMSEIKPSTKVWALHFVVKILSGRVIDNLNSVMRFNLEFKDFY